MIVRRIFFVVGLMLMLPGAWAQGVKQQSGSVSKKTTGKATTKPSGKKTDKSPKTLLWEISGNGLREPSYLFGTMHILCADEASLSDNLRSVISRARKIYFEIDMDDMTEMMGALKYVKMNDGVKLSDLLTKDEYARVEAYFKKSKTPMPLSMLNRFKPMFVSSLLGEQQMDCPQKEGMEQLIMKEASKKDKTIMGLESVQFQATLFDSIPYETQAKDLLSYIDSVDNYRKSTAEMVAVYKQQDLEKLDSMVRKSDPSMNSYMDLLLYSRNRRWVQQMPNIMMEGTLLFAVGAGHLPGDQGVINLLRKRGFTVKPVPNEWQSVNRVKG